MTSQQSNNAHNMALLSYSESNDSDGIQLSISRGADVNYGEGLPLYLAAENDAVDAIHTLMKYGADVHAGGDMALYAATSAGKIQSVRVLVIDYGADASTNKSIELARHRGLNEIYNTLVISMRRPVDKKVQKINKLSL